MIKHCMDTIVLMKLRNSFRQDVENNAHGTLLQYLSILLTLFKQMD